jgi:hypothetical protein
MKKGSNDRIVNAFEKHGIQFTNRQKEIVRETADKYLPKCAFCGEEADYKIEDLNKPDKEFKICASCLLNRWIPMVEEVYKAISKATQNYDSAKQDEFSHQQKYR